MWMKEDEGMFKVHMWVKKARMASSPSASLVRLELIKAVGKEGRGNEQRGTSSEESISCSSCLGGLEPTHGYEGRGGRRAQRGRKARRQGRQ